VPDKGPHGWLSGFEDGAEDQLPSKAIILIGDGESRKVLEYGYDYTEPAGR